MVPLTSRAAATFRWNRERDALESQIRMAMSLDQATRSDPARDADLHRRLVAVIEQGDEQEIADEVRNHIAHSADEIVRLMEEGEPA